ncbi:MAG: DUF4875 domain-containing protein [Candidatus Eisenbacteria bacterium]|nr:DUF4875 domain-containing protein [Candidatus Eisenbacteria bacterium]
MRGSNSLPGENPASHRQGAGGRSFHKGTVWESRRMRSSTEPLGIETLHRRSLLADLFTINRRTKQESAMLRSVFAVAILAFVTQAAHGGLDLSRAQPYEVVYGPEEMPAVDREAQVWYITSDADSLAEFAQTSMKAALDLQSEYGPDYITVFLVPHVELIGSGPHYGRASYAADGLGSKGLDRSSGSGFRYQWFVKAATRTLSDRELSIAVAWQRLAPRYPEKDMTSSAMADIDALRQAVADSLNLDPDKVEPPRLRRDNYLKQ